MILDKLHLPLDIVLNEGDYLEGMIYTNPSRLNDLAP